MVRCPLVFILLLLAIPSFGQDSCALSFGKQITKTTTEHESKIAKCIDGRRVEGVLILAQLSEQGAVSENRILSELRLQAVKELLLNKGVPFNLITTSIIFKENKGSMDRVYLTFKLGDQVGEKVLKKTPIVQISEVDYTIKKSPAVVEKKKEPKEDDPIIAVEKNEILSVTEFKKNELISLPNLLFEPGTHFLLPGSEKVLVELLNVMRAKPKLRIELQGHICCRLGGLDGFDPTTGRENLSEMRAKVVYLFLVSKGIKKYRMTYKGFGSSQKLYPDLHSVSAQRMNRRVEVLVTSTE